MIVSGKKVLLIGPNYYNYLTAAAQSFTRLGWKPVIEAYDNPIHPYTRIMKVKWKLSRDKASMRIRSRKLFNDYIRNRYCEVKPDFVFIMNGEILEAPTLDFFRKSSKVALWFFDNRIKLPLSIGHVDHVDAFFCFDRNDVELFRSEGKTSTFLPQACDTNVYMPLNIERDIDILFIGNIYGSLKRKEVCNYVIGSFPEKKIVICGLFKPWYKGLLQWAFREHRSIYTNCNVTPSVANELYNRSKVVLNIHKESQNDGANPRVFEICGSGSYQLCDCNPYIESVFEDGEIGIWHNEHELVSMINYALNHDMSVSAQKAYQKVLDNHSFDVRMKTVLDTVFV